MPMPVTTTRRIAAILSRGPSVDRPEPSGRLGQRHDRVRRAGLPRIDEGGGLAVAGEVGLHEDRVVGRPGPAEDQVEAALRVGLVAVQDGGDQARG